MNTVFQLADLPVLAKAAAAPASGVANPVTAGLLMDVDFANPASVFTDVARTARASHGDLVRGVADTSGQGNHWFQADADLCPRYVVGARAADTYADCYRMAEWGDNLHAMYLSFTARLTTVRTAFWVMNPHPASWGSGVGTRAFLLGDAANYDFHSDDSGSNGYFHHSYSLVNAIWVDGVSRDRSYYAREQRRLLLSATTSANAAADEFQRDRTASTFPFRGYLHRFCCYSTVLSDDARQKVESAFQNGYRTTE